MVNFLKKRNVVGIDISDHSIEVLQMQKGAEVLAYGRTILDAGIVEGGTIMQKDKLVSALREVLRSTKPVNLQPSIDPLEVILSIPESHTFFQYYEFPGIVKDHELESKILSEATKAIPLHPKEMYWDFIKLKSRTQEKKLVKKTTGGAPSLLKISLTQNKEGTITAVLYVAAPKIIVDDYIRVMHAARLKVIAIDAEILGLGRALIFANSSDAKDTETTMLVDVGAWSTAIGFFDNSGTLHFSANVPIGGNTLSKAIAEKLNISFPDAEDMKKEFGLKPSPDNKILPIVEPSIKQLGYEIKMLKDYYTAKNKTEVASVILAGGSSNLMGLDGYFKSLIGINVEIGNPLSHLKESHKLPGDLPPILFSNAIGLALRALDQDPVNAGINLLPKEGYKAIVQMPIEQKVTDITSGPIIPSRQITPQTISEALPAERGRHLNFAEFFGTFVFALGFLVVAVGFLAVVVYKYILQEGGITIITQQQKFETYTPPENAPPTQSTTIPPEKDIAQEQNLSTDETLPQDAENNIIEESAVNEVVINETPTGWLNVREDAGTNYPVIGRVNPGETYPLLEENKGWFRIKLNDSNDGWILAQYATKRE